ncbi:hypothetical protein OK351_07045 [Glutamicibacter sp. MNS18]|uniref:hypothetical protein n=1 Tax=Glutamicibacter sp. MNS18 TaxID=2989817 RepID=UPI002235EF64|nr:hypothetical protein [Glutamicibacter sp. MNS18]MCW4465257.1 hypothetical protein [Glutamicibacter sp. MNS18]
MSPTSHLGRELDATELAEFIGGQECQVTITYNPHGQVNGVKTSGDCQNVTINVSVAQQ